MFDTNKLSRTSVRRAIAVCTLSLLAAACVRHLPVVGDEDEPARGGASGKGPIAGIGARRSAESAQRAAAGGTPDQEEEPSESDTPAAGSSGSKAAPSGGAPKAEPNTSKAGASAGASPASAGKAGAAAPGSAAAMGGSAAPSTPSMSSGGNTPSGSSSGNTWYCAQAANACSCAEAPAGSATPGDTCTSPHPTCCYEFTNTTTYRTCVCVPDGSPECMAYSMNAIQNIKKISSCPL